MPNDIDLDELDLQAAYAHGEHCYHAHWRRTSNPYPTGTDQWQAWDNGWTDSEECAQ